MLIDKPITAANVVQAIPVMYCWRTTESRKPWSNTVASEGSRKPGLSKNRRMPSRWKYSHSSDEQDQERERPDDRADERAACVVARRVDALGGPGIGTECDPGPRHDRVDALFGRGRPACHVPSDGAHEWAPRSAWEISPLSSPNAGSKRRSGDAGIRERARGTRRRCARGGRSSRGCGSTGTRPR